MNRWIVVAGGQMKNFWLDRRKTREDPKMVEKKAAIVRRLLAIQKLLDKSVKAIKP
jgi:hypothetical protein